MHGKSCICILLITFNPIFLSITFIPVTARAFYSGRLISRASNTRRKSNNMRATPASELQTKMFHKDANSRVASEMRNIEYRSRKGRRSVVECCSFRLWIPPLSPRIGELASEIFQNPFRYKRDCPIIFYSAAQFAARSYFTLTLQANVKIAASNLLPIIPIT